MAQADYIISNQTFPNTRADINNHLEAIATNNSGTSAPTTQYAGQFWIDTTSTTWTLYIHDGTDDIQFATIDTSANTVNFTDSALDVVTDTTPQLGGNLDLNSNDITGTGNINITGNLTASGNLTSLGIDDNATANAITIGSDETVTIVKKLVVDTDTLVVDNTNNRVGIGTSSPDDILHIVSTDAITILQRTTDVGNNSTLSSSIFKNSDSTVSALANFNKSGSTKNSGADGYEFRLSNFGNGYTSFFNDGSESMRIDSSGNVGIGTSSPASYDNNANGISSNLVVADSGHSGIIVISGTSSDATISFGDGTGADAYRGAIAYVNSQDKLYFKSASSNRMVIDSSGNVGIGTTSPSQKLDVSGNVTISGSLSKGSGSFKIDHPLPEKTDTHHLVHSFVEAPQADNIYRGKVDLVNGTATVNIDTVAGMSEGTFVLLNREIQCFTSNETGWTAVKGSVSGNILTITAQDETCTDTISWLVIGERQDQHMYDTEWTDENGKVIVEPLKPVEEETIE